MTTPLSHRLRPSLAWLASLLVFATAGAAQRAPSWALEPSTGLNPAAVQHLGKLLFFVDSADVLHVFSSATRTWRTRTLAPNAVVRNSNDWLLIQEGSRFTAFGSMRAGFETLQLGAGARILNPVGQRNDGVALVLDGSTVHAFAGLVGRWVPLAVSPQAQIAVQREVCVVAEPATGAVTGMSATAGRWVAAPGNLVGAPLSIDADGSIGIVDDGTTVFGFSAVRDRWSSAPSLGAGTLVDVRRDVATWTDGATLLGFSGVRGEFASLPIANPPVVTHADHLAFADTGNGLFRVFAAARAAWRVVAAPIGATPQIGGAVALWTDGAQTTVEAYSALVDATASLPLAGATTAVNTTVAAALAPSTGELWLFSAMTGQWHRAPSGAQASVPQLSRNGAVVLGTGARHWAFSARSGRFVPIDVTPGGVPVAHVDTSSSPLALEDGAGRLSVFEPRREVWLPVPLPNGLPLDVRIWRTTLLAFTDTAVAGFGVGHGAVETFSLPSPAVDKRASSEVGAAILADGVIGFSAVSDLTTVAQFPEFRRMATPGSTVDLHLRGPGLSAVAAVAGFASATPQFVPGLGEFLLDPVRPVVTLTPLTSLPGSGHRVLPIPVVDDSRLAGLELGFQALVLPPTGSTFLTRLATVQLR